MPLHFTVSPNENALRLGVFLRRRGASVACVRSVKFCEDGLLVNGVRRRTSWPLVAGDVVSITLPPEEYSALPQELPLEIVYESPRAMVINKPAGMVMHPTRSHHDGTLANAFCGEMRRRGQVAAFRCAGRLDVNTSGLVVCAMDAFAAPVLAAGLQKTYTALVGGRLPLGDGVIDAPLAPREDSVILQRVHPAGKPSVTKYTVLAACEEASLVQVRPQTGRTHQIRVHFAHLGHPLLGDELYGGACSRMQRHALHAGQVLFRQPGDEKTVPVCVQVPLPADMAQLVHTFGFDAAMF